MTQIKFTEVGKSYWDSNGAYQEEHDRLYDSLVPARGSAPTINGELIRCIGRLTYDFFNNGNCNVIEIERHECESCGGSGYEEEVDEDGHQDDCYNCGGEIYLDGDAFITPYYSEMMEFLHEFAQDKVLIREFEQYILRNQLGWDMCSYNSHIYSRVMDSIMYQVLISDGLDSNPYYNKEENV